MHDFLKFLSRVDFLIEFFLNLPLSTTYITNKHELQFNNLN